MSYRLIDNETNEDIIDKLSRIKDERDKYEKILDKIKEYIKNTEELYLVENYEEEGLMTPIKNIEDLLEEIE